MTKALSESERALFDGKNFGHLATVGRDGAPQVTPVWVDLEGDFVLVNTARDRVKERNVRRDPRVAISIFDSANPYRMVSVAGEVVDQTEEGADAHIDALAKKYLGAERYPGRTPGERRVILRIRPHGVVSMGL